MSRTGIWDLDTAVQPFDHVFERKCPQRIRLIVGVVLSVLLVPLAWMPQSLAGTASSNPPSSSSNAAKDEVELVAVPAGEFTMGHNSSYDTLPVRSLNLPAFSIDKYEVTNKRYKRFIDATGYKVPWSQEPAVAAYIWDWQKRMYPEGKGDDPVVLVSWEDARAFCAWAGKRLPTEAEWEKAARGAKGKPHPWGNDWANGKANTSESGLKQTAPAGSFKEDVSEYGVNDLAGNVSEWVEEWFAPYPGNPMTSYEERNKYRVLRGGSWDYAHSIGNGYHRQYALPQSQMTAIGFRCVKIADATGGSPSRPQTR
ncbi:MAG TPA: SUMF1/EgtB/PvdO family nonheme iron enzyme [Candidatus Tectomicrobia bacterium]